MVTMTYNTRLICLKVSTVALFMTLLQVVDAQGKWDDVDKAITTKQALLGKDMVVYIAQKDSVLFQKTVGDFNAKTAAPIASASKWLTAALVMQAVDEGKVSLDDKIIKYLPVFEKYGKNYITIRHCLSHMTGIQTEPVRILKLLERKKVASLEEEVNNFATKEIQNNAGEAFRYGNIGLNIAGRIMEVVYKKKFEQLIRQKLLVPLGMRKTTFQTMDGSAPNPSGGAVSTAEDYLKFLQMILNNGSFGGKQILSANAVAEMRKINTTTAQIKYAPKSAEGFMYASGSWVLEVGNDSKQAAVLASPGLFGTWPMVDFSRDYVSIFFVKNVLGEERADAYLEIKKTIDSHLPVKR